MPTTINGIGTHYYGKRNLQTRQGTCEHCHGQGQLSSYETRLWFVVLFIPVIPLGRKQIIDQCRFCTRHRAASLGEFQRAGEQAVSKSTGPLAGVEGARRQQSGPEPTIGMSLQRLRAAGDEAAEVLSSRTA